MKKTFTLIAFTLLIASQLVAQSITVNESAGYLESAYVKWSPVADATSYNVYYKDASSSDATYTAINRMQIREYTSYFRADVVGLKAGTYKIKIVPVINKIEDASKEATTADLNVKPYIREGFAFSANSPLKTGSGAYNDDGTLKSTAKVVYLTSKTANTMELGVVTDSKGKIETCLGIVNILAAKQKGYDTTPLAVRIVGEVKASDITGLNSSSYIQVKGKGAYTELNMTIEGIGDDATTNGWSILVRGAGNIEIRNLGIMNFGDDGVSLDTENTNIWVHNNDFFYGVQGSGDKAKGDGSFDLKGNSQYVTSSFNHFWDSGKASLCGMTGESAPNYISYHHNWFDHSDSRHPRVRTMSVHVYNNYFDGNAKYGIGATTGSSVFVENNYFRNCKYPMLISKQGTDVFYDSTGTFSGEDGGMIKSFGNTILGATRLVDQNTSATAFDAIAVSSRDEKVADTYKTLQGATTYDNFDTNPALMYSYAVESPENAKNTTMQYAGRINGGDLKWVFNNAVDDTSYDINQGLRAAVNNYKGTVVAIGFEESGSVDPDPDPVDPTAPGDVIHDFTENASASQFFTIVGSLSTSKGSVEYGGKTLTQCLKIESATSISFTTTEESTLTMVFNSTFAGAIKINGTLYNATAGILEVVLPAGVYAITRSEACNLYYMSVKYTTGIAIEGLESTSCSLYPNPVVDNLTIASQTEIKGVEVYNLVGIRVLEVKGNVRTVDMSQLGAGSYVVNVITVEGLYKKIVIKK